METTDIATTTAAKKIAAHQAIDTSNPIVARINSIDIHEGVAGVKSLSLIKAACHADPQYKINGWSQHSPQAQAMMLKASLLVRGVDPAKIDSLVAKQFPGVRVEVQTPLQFRLVHNSRIDHPIKDLGTRGSSLVGAKTFTHSKFTTKPVTNNHHPTPRIPRKT